MDTQISQWIALLVGVALPLSPVVAAFVAGIKLAIGRYISDAYWPLVSIAVGVAVAQFAGWILIFDWRMMLAAGSLAGLMAAGLYTAGKAVDRAMPSE